MPLSREELLRMKELLERELRNKNIDSNRRLAIQKEIALINSCLCKNKEPQEKN